MKKFAQISLLLIVAVTVFLTGAGVTIVNYCCTSCSGQTLFMTGIHTCCDKINYAEENQSCCSHHETICDDTNNGFEYGKDTHCTASRLSIDIDASSFRPQVSIPFVWISDASFTLPAILLPDDAECTNDYIHFKTPPDISPREYLSFIRVLII